MARTTTTTPVPAAAPAATPMTTVSGFAVSILAFIPIDPKDLRKQAEIPLLLLDIQEGKKTVADLAPYLKDTEFRQQHIRKRFTVEEAKRLMGQEPVLDEQEDKSEGEDIPDEQDYADRDMED